MLPCACNAQQQISLVPFRWTGLNEPMTTSASSGAFPIPTIKPGFDQLLTAVGKDRDRAAFIELFHHFAPRIKSFLMKGGATPELAEELTQETMLTVWSKAASFDPSHAQASTWIFTIARNKRIDALRKKTANTQSLDLDEQDPAFVPETTSPPTDLRVLEADRTDRIAEAIKTLPPEQSELIRKSYFEDKTHQEIAQETRLPLGTVKSRLRLALNHLRPVLSKEML